MSRVKGSKFNFCVPGSGLNDISSKYNEYTRWQIPINVKESMFLVNLMTKFRYAQPNMYPYGNVNRTIPRENLGMINWWLKVLTLKLCVLHYFSLWLPSTHCEVKSTFQFTML